MAAGESDSYFIHVDGYSRSGNAKLHMVNCNSVVNRKPDPLPDNHWLGPFTPLRRARQALLKTGKRIRLACPQCLPSIAWEGDL